jgi:GNAT superfamily N-acetyltransferase
MTITFMNALCLMERRMDKGNDLVIRPMKRHEFDLALVWAAREGWNPGLHDADAFYNSDPTGHFVALLSKVPVGCISAVAYGDTFGFIGLYIVKPEHRGKGYGIKLWRQALHRLERRNVGLDGVLERQQDYERDGFVYAYRNIRYELGIMKIAIPRSVVDLRKKYSIHDVAEYEKNLFPAPRILFLQKWLNPPQGVALGLEGNNGRLAGYGVIRKCIKGSKIGPLFADNLNGARELLYGLMGHAPEPPIYIDIPEANGLGIDLVKESDVSKVSETARMYNVCHPNLDLSRIYGVSTLELG